MFRTGCISAKGMDVKIKKYPKKVEVWLDKVEVLSCFK